MWKQQLLDGHIHAHSASSVASLLLALHKASAADTDLCRSFEHDEDFVAIRLSPYFLHTADKHPAVDDTLHALVKQTLSHKTVLVHGDVSPKNILMGPQGTVLLDAECACFGDPAFYMAFVLTHLMLKCVWRPTDTASYLTCFYKLSDTYLSGVDWESPSDLEARTCLLLAGMLLARIDGKSPVEYLTHSTHLAFVRAHSLHWLKHPPLRLAEMRQLWNPA